METEIPLNELMRERQPRECEETKKNKLKGVKKYFNEYCKNTTLNGFNYLAEDRSLGERLLWAILILGAVIWSIYMIWEIYNKYEENPFIVSLATRESPIYTIPFPAVTFCPLAKSNKEMFNFTSIVNKIWDNEKLTPDEVINGHYMSLICDYLDDSVKNYFSANTTFTDEIFEKIDEIKIDFNFTFQQCYFMGNEIPCEELFTPIILDDGVCYTSNMLSREDIFRENVAQYQNFHQTGLKSNWSIDEGYPKGSGRNVYPKRALLSGADKALEVYFMQYVHDVDYLCVRDVQGFNVHLHTPHTIPQLKKQYFTVPLDKAVLAVVQPKLMTTSKEVKKYKPTDRLCYFADEKFLTFFKIYTPDNCRLECLTNYTLNKCKCVNFFMPRERSTPICGNAMMQCMSEAEYELTENELADELEGGSDFRFKCDCMPLCSELSYDMETSRTDWNWREQFRAEKKLMKDLAGVENIVHYSKLSVFFKSDKFLTSQRNELYGFMDFLANFGGLLGLFTGFSLLSAVEIIYFVSVRLWCNKRLYNDYTGPQEV